MANDEHLAILRQGVEVWNEWRKENPLIKPDLIEANFNRANLYRADLSSANLYMANLHGAYLEEAKFTSAFLHLADLSFAELSSANFSLADLYSADLISANLSRVQALETNFTAANLTGACIKDWNINSNTNFTKVICDFIYLETGSSHDDNIGYEYLERRPNDSNRKFVPGEFTKIFQKIQQTVDLLFINGIDWQAFLISFQKLQVEWGGEELSIQAIENKNDGAFVIRVNVPADANKAEIEKYLKREYELAVAALEAKYQIQLQGKDEQIEIYRKQSADLTEIVKLLAGRATYDLRNSQFGGSLINAETVNTDEIGGNIHNNNA
ncbi:pentapeptide repeat-containing protein [Anabaena sp. UHCC 0399]|uniref:pentapeptide repeat-containing protein n=1 Tax=Anabaena sp. UHCC 0399 TaxID=3110238 RepID=UPI002B201E8D|nr:pentapeptide repeat-containing protein [Anabaena sp. UHCC 0399]MEA5567789.1 pentapeptide repeat-containing protein [Anabaena sp. UHCC 0399]